MRPKKEKKKSFGVEKFLLHFVYMLVEGIRGKINKEKKMAISVTKGGAFRGTEHSNAHKAIYECPICGTMNTKRQSFFVRGARFCRKHGNQNSVIMVMNYRNKRKGA